MSEGQYEGQPNAGAGTPEASDGLVISQRPQRYSAKWGEHELALVKTQADVAISAEDAQHRRGEQIKDNNQRRTITNSILALVIAAYVLTGVAAVWAPDAETRDRAWDVLTALIGALLGSIAGYFAGDRKR